LATVFFANQKSSLLGGCRVFVSTMDKPLLHGGVQILFTSLRNCFL